MGLMSDINTEVCSSQSIFQRLLAIDTIRLVITEEAVL